MTAKDAYDDVEVGTALPSQTFPIMRVNLVQYCGASGDFNVIHWNERIAKAVGLPDVIAHGMFTMAEAGRVVTDWVGDPGAVVEYGVRFSAPVVVPDEDGATLVVNATVAEKLDDNRVAIDLDARVGETKVLGPGDTWRILAHVRHSVVAGPTGAVAIESFAPGRDDWTDRERVVPRAPHWPK